jgi:hypothetical protein
MAEHIPINHPLRPLFRTAAGLVAIWLLIFGAVGLNEAQDGGWFDRGDWSVMGVPTNRAFAVASLAAGAVILIATVVGRNLDRFVYLAGGIGFLVAGTLEMAVLHTDANVFNFSITTSVVSYVIGLILLTAGLYGKSGTREEAAAEEAFRHGEISPPEYGPRAADEASDDAPAAEASAPDGTVRSRRD